MNELLEPRDVVLAPELVKLLSEIESDASFQTATGVKHALQGADLEAATLQGLAEPILMSPALTERVLRLANAAAVRRGEPVTTVSKAVALLGFYSVKSIALMLAFLEDVPDEGQRGLMLRETAQSTAAMTLARELARLSANDSQRAGVQAALCALGRVLVAAKMPETFSAIKAQARHERAPENDVARRRLGMGYHQIAARGAASWRLGEDLCQFLSKSDAHVEGTGLAAKTADTVAGLLFTGSGVQSEQVSRVLDEFARRTQQAPEKVQSAIEAGLDDFARLSRTLGFPDSIAQELLQGTLEEEVAVAPVDEAGKTLSDLAAEVTRQAARDVASMTIVAHMLDRLVQQGRFQRAVFLVRDREGRGWMTRACRGAGEQALLSLLCLPVTEPLNLLSAALERNTGLTIKDTHAEKVRAVLPPWFDTRLPRSACFVLLPISAGGRTVAALYLDRAQPGAVPEGAELDALMGLKDALTLALRRN